MAKRKENKAETAIRGFLTSLGYEVRRIPRAKNIRRADYRAKRSDERLLLEVKHRDPDERFERDLELKGHAGKEQPLGRINVISRQVKDAADQLERPTRSDRAALRLVALVSLTPDWEVHASQFRATLYGAVDLLFQDANMVVALPCYYFTFSDFFRFTWLDGALFNGPGRAQLCLNPLSVRSAALSASYLAQSLRAQGAVVDPHAQEALGEAFIADTDLDRRNESAVLDFVRAKYHRSELQSFKPIKVTAAVRTPYEALGHVESGGLSA